MDLLWSLTIFRVQNGAPIEKSGINKETGEYETIWKVYDKPPLTSKLSLSKTKAIKNSNAVRIVTMKLPTLRNNRTHATAIHSKWLCSCCYFKQQTPIMYCNHIMYVIMMRFPITDWPKEN